MSSRQGPAQSAGRLRQAHGILGGVNRTDRTAEHSPRLTIACHCRSPLSLVELRMSSFSWLVMGSGTSCQIRCSPQSPGRCSCRAGCRSCIICNLLNLCRGAWQLIRGAADRRRTGRY